MSSLPQPAAPALAHSAELRHAIRREIEQRGGWMPFARFMELALYAPGLGYYNAGAQKFGAAGDFVTAPELSALFGRTLAQQIAEIMQLSAPHILELGAGSGKLAADLLLELERINALPERYAILEVSADLRQRQQEYLRQHAPHLFARLHWLDELPEQVQGAVIGNEVLDALPVHLVRWRENGYAERGVVCAGENFGWQEIELRPSALLQTAQAINAPAGTLSEISLAARGLVASLCERLTCGVLLFIDYGFGGGEYYHPQRAQGTLMCHYRHLAHDDPLTLAGLQDITAHVDFSAVYQTALAGGAALLGYTTQAHFLINCGIAALLQQTPPQHTRGYAPLAAQFQRLTSPAEMGELFKVIALGKNVEAALCGFTAGDLSRLL
jgi:SAM-dependent MidA family methyltransferase